MPHVKRLTLIPTVFAALALPVFTLSAAWRSSLYPENWQPGARDAQGRFLHDFSYAGYHRGERAIPDHPPGAVYDVTQPPYNADSSGGDDATAAIQAAINDAGAAGGGIVFLPEGTYTVAPGANSCSLRIRSNGVVLRGAGAARTFLLNTATVMRGKKMILFQPSSGSWHTPLAGSSRVITEDCGYPITTIPLENVAGLSVGDTVILRADCTEGFIADHLMTGKWDASLLGMTFCRRITAIDAAAMSVTIDIPTRYYLKRRDNARLYKVAPHLEECGIENLSIGMREHTGTGWGDLDYAVPGTAAYDVHGSLLMLFSHAKNCWARGVKTYRPPSNSGNHHILSNGIEINKSIHVTIRECDVRRPQYEGEGGNGYGFVIRSNDSLVQNCTAVHTRHNYDFKSMWTSGNVIHRCLGATPRLSSDFHMHLSVANLFDCTTLDGDWLQAVYRPYGTVEHGHATTESVFWNTYGIGSGTAVQSSQWGWGYVIGTSGGRQRVERNTSYNSAPLDHLEGEGSGDRLEPQSLYEDQLYRRLCAGLAPPNPFGYVLLDNFAMYPPGAAVKGHGKWGGDTASADEFRIVADPEDSANTVLHFNRGVNTEIFLTLPDLRITNGTVSTLFFRLRVDPSENALGGLFFRVTLSDVASPVNFNDGETDITFSGSAETGVRVNNLAPVTAGTWHDCWLVADTGTDTFSFSIAPENGVYSEVISQQPFRNGTAANDLVSLMLKTYANNGIGSDGDAWIDAIYIAHGADARRWTPVGGNRDNDLLPDCWELNQFGCLSVSAGASDEDYDGDGFIDRHEWLAGTDATDSASLLAVESIENANGTILTWQAVSGRSYSVQGKVSLGDATWSTIASGIAGSHPSCVYTAGVERIEKFFRVFAEPAD